MSYWNRTGNRSYNRDLWETGNFHSGSPTSCSFHDQKTGQSLKSWSYLVKHKLDAGTSYTRYSYSTDISSLPEQWMEKRLISSGALIDKVGIKGLAIWSDPFLLINKDPSVALQNQALAKFVSACLNAQRSVSSFTVIGEIRDTLKTLRHPIEGISRGVSRYLDNVTKHCKSTANTRKYKLSGPTQRAKILNDVVAGTWLEASFGWIPLFQDIDGIFDAVQNRKINLYPPTKEVKGSAFNDSIFSKSDTQNFSWFTNYSNINRGRLRYLVKYKGAVKVNLPSALDNFQRNAGFGLRDVIPSIWEIIPWSFFVDYFINVQAILDSYSLARSDIAWVSKIYHTEYWGEVTTKFGTFKTGLWDPSFYYAKVGPLNAGFGTSSLKYYFRTTPGSLIPVLYFSLPAINSKKWANISALTSQVLSSQKTVRTLI